MRGVVESVEFSSRIDSPPIYLFVREEDGRRARVTVTGFHPHLFVDGRKIPGATGTAFKTLDGRFVDKVYVTQPKLVSKKREEFEKKWIKTYEADIPLSLRYLIDSGIYGGMELSSSGEIAPCNCYIEPRVLFLDIETLANGNMKDKFSNPIIIIGCYDSYERKFVQFTWGDLPALEGLRVFSSEKEMLTEFVKQVKRWNPDIISGWNVNLYDLLCIVQRLDVNRIDRDWLSPFPGYAGVIAVHEASRPYVKIRGRAILDLLTAYRLLSKVQLPDYRLGTVARSELQVEKIPLREGISETWHKDPIQVIRYNLRDVEILTLLDDKLRIIDYFDRLRIEAGCPLEYALYHARMADVFLLREARKRKLVLENRGKKEDEGLGYKGARITEPIIGVHEKVAYLDIVSLYPTIVRKWNVSPDSLIETDEENGRETRLTDERGQVDVIRLKTGTGFIPEIIGKLLDERERNKTLLQERYDRTLEVKQDALKIQANTLYGFFGDPSSRLGKRGTRLAKLITSLGRQIHHDFEKLLVEKNIQPIYGDTDSIFLLENSLSGTEFGSIAALIAYLERELNTLYPGQPSLRIKLEKQYEKFVLLSKKRYVGLWRDQLEEAHFDEKGIQAKRSDTSEVSAEIQRELVRRILLGTTEESVRDWLSEVINKFLKGGYSLDKIGIPATIRKPLSRYKTQSVYAKAALFSNALRGTSFGLGDRPLRVYIEPFKTRVVDEEVEVNVMAYDKDERDLPYRIDYARMLKATIYEKVKDIAEISFPSLLSLFPTHSKRVGSRKLKGEDSPFYNQASQEILLNNYIIHMSSDAHEVVSSTWEGVR